MRTRRRGATRGDTEAPEPERLAQSEYCSIVKVTVLSTRAAPRLLPSPHLSYILRCVPKLSEVTFLVVSAQLSLRIYWAPPVASPHPGSMQLQGLQFSAAPLA
jgi:hypothetical protein